jgi:hypothetical protein
MKTYRIGLRVSKGTVLGDIGWRLVDVYDDATILTILLKTGAKAQMITVNGVDIPERYLRPRTIVPTASDTQLMIRPECTADLFELVILEEV